MISLINHHLWWGRSEVVIIYAAVYSHDMPSISKLIRLVSLANHRSCSHSWTEEFPIRSFFSRSDMLSSWKHKHTIWVYPQMAYSSKNIKPQNTLSWPTLDTCNKSGLWPVSTIPVKMLRNITKLPNQLAFEIWGACRLDNWCSRRKLACYPSNYIQS